MMLIKRLVSLMKNMIVRTTILLCVQQMLIKLVETNKRFNGIINKYIKVVIEEFLFFVLVLGHHYRHRHFSIATSTLFLHHFCHHQNIEISNIQTIRIDVTRTPHPAMSTTPGII